MWGNRADPPPTPTIRRDKLCSLRRSERSSHHHAIRRSMRRPRYHFDLRRGQTVDHRRQGRAACARARSQRLSHAALPEPDLDLVSIDHAYEFDVRSFGEGRMSFDLRADGAPINALETVYEDAAMWIAHRRCGELDALSVDVQPLPDNAIEPCRHDDRNPFTRKTRRPHFRLENHTRPDQVAAINGL